MKDSELSQDHLLENARIKYQVAIEKHSAEAQFSWSRYSAMLTFHTLFLALIGLVYKKEIGFPSGTLLLPIFGIIVCYLWDTMTSRSFQWNHFWIDTARKIEEKYLKDERNELNPIMQGKEQREKIIGWPNVELSSHIIIVVMTLLYFGIFLASIGQFVLKK